MPSSHVRSRMPIACDRSRRSTSHPDKRDSKLESRCSASGSRRVFRSNAHRLRESNIMNCVPAYGKTRIIVALQVPEEIGRDAESRDCRSVEIPRPIVWPQKNEACQNTPMQLVKVVAFFQCERCSRQSNDGGILTLNLRKYRQSALMVITSSACSISNRSPSNNDEASVASGM